MVSKLIWRCNWVFDCCILVLLYPNNCPSTCFSQLNLLLIKIVASKLQKSSSLIGRATYNNCGGGAGSTPAKHLLDKSNAIINEH